MIGDGIRRNIATVTKEERDRFRDAILKLSQTLYAGSKTDTPVAGGVSHWFKYDEIHDSTHVHGCPAFLPWHRELMNRFEADLRSIDPELSLHYWDWTQDPTHAPDGEGGFVNLLTSDFMGNSVGLGNTEIEIGEPWKSATQGVSGAVAFYGGSGPYRDDTANPADPPQLVTRQVGVFGTLLTPMQDQALLGALDFVTFDSMMQGPHGQGHGYIGGTLGDPHTSFRDPIVFLLHSNVDRLFAMWQRQPAHPERFDPNEIYKNQSAGHDGYQNTKGGDRTTADPTETSFPGDNDVSSLHPWWGILSPLEPWAGPGNTAQTAATGIIQKVKSVRPWAPPESEQEWKDSRDASVVSPPSYDTAPHSSYFIADRDTFSDSEVAATTNYPAALTLIYDGFRANELGGATPTPPSFSVTFDSAGGSNASAFITVTAEPPLLETAVPDVPQRITFAVDVQFADPSVFNGFTDLRLVHLRATHGTVVTDATLELLKQPNPYMLDGATTWLSTDVRVFQITPNNTVNSHSSTHLDDPASNPNAPLDYINALLNECRTTADDANHPFENITLDEGASILELAQTIGSTPVFNFALAKVRYRANTVPASNVQVFFRAFSTLYSALDYTYSGGAAPANYPRSGSWPNAVPLLGVVDGEIASIPFFAVGRIDSTAAPMTMQPLDTPNIQPINAAAGQESVMFFGCWLDINQPQNRFPLQPAGAGPYSSALPIPQIMHGLHHCLVAEIFFQPGGGTDPIPSGATPASSDRLAQRNLAVDESGNPSGGATHTVAHSFVLKQSFAPKPRQEMTTSDVAVIDAGSVVSERFANDELMIRWNELPRATRATLFVPDWDVDEVLRLASMRQHPQVLQKVDAHTLSINVADVAFVPIPRGLHQNNPALLTLELPLGVRWGQVYRVDVHQYSRMRRRFLGAFRMTIPVKTDEEMLPRQIRRLAVLRYISLAIPANDRWSLIFDRWIDVVSNKVQGLGGNPAKVPPSLTDPSGTLYPPGEGDERCDCRYSWLVSLLVALFVTLLAALPLRFRPVITAGGLIVVIAAFCAWRFRCSIQKCDVVHALLLGFAVGGLALALATVGGLVSALVPLVLCGIAEGILAVLAVVLGCWGSCPIKHKSEIGG